MKPLLILALTATLLHAQGPLTPPGAPVPSMKTLAQIEARTPISADDFLIDTPGSYYLTKDVRSIFIRTPDVTLDLNGFTVRVRNGSTGINVVLDSAIPTSSRTITIQNGTVAGSGVWTPGSTAGTSTYSAAAGSSGIYSLTSGINMDKVTISGCTRGIFCFAATSGGGQHRITNCIIHDFSLDGIKVQTAIITNSIISKGRGTGVNGIILTTDNLLIYDIDGIGLEDYGASVHRGTVVRQVSGIGIKGSNFSLSGANTSACGGGGIQGSSLQIENCTSSYNTGSGINAIDSTLQNCLARNNSSAGIFAPDSVITGCKVLYNGTDGIAAPNSIISQCKASASDQNTTDGYIGTSLIWTGGRQVDNVSDSYVPAAPAP